MVGRFLLFSERGGGARRFSEQVVNEPTSIRIYTHLIHEADFRHMIGNAWHLDDPRVGMCLR